MKRISSARDDLASTLGLKRRVALQKNSAPEEAVSVAGRYGRFKTGHDAGANAGSPFVDVPPEILDVRVPTKYEYGTRVLVGDFLNHPLCEMFMLVLTVVALFITDGNQVWGERDADVLVQWTCLFIMLVFTIELILLSYSKSNYFCVDTYFWLDLLACVSLIGDVPADIISLVIPSGMVAAKVSG